MRRRTPAAAAAAATMMIVTACSGAPAVGARTPAAGVDQPDEVIATETSAELAAKKKAAGIADCPPSDAAVPPVEGGLPDLVLECLGGGRTVRLAGLRGRPMMINLWAQWCGPCRQEAPFIAEVAALNKDELMILGVDYADPLPGKALDFAQLSGWRFPQLADQDKAMAAPLHIVGPPQTFFVTAEGEIAYRHTGAFTSATQIRELARRHLGITL